MSYENVPVHLNTTTHCFEMNLQDGYAFIDYKQTRNTFYLIHTEVAEALEGRGIAALLVEKTMQYLEKHQLTMIPSCSYIQHYLRKHTEWNRLIADE